MGSIAERALGRVTAEEVNKTLIGVIVEKKKKNGLAYNIENFIYGGELKNSQ